ncbi:MAG: lysophospholipid acyltransferase family protein [Planctomycetota bacterium]|nr:lysophospholipid acyltransferase family protein [Planctomycetota bacterium]
MQERTVGESTLDSFRFLRPVVMLARLVPRKAFLLIALALGRIASRVLKGPRAMVVRNVDWLAAWNADRKDGSLQGRAEREAVVRRTFQNFACGLVEYVFLSLLTPRTVRSIFRIDRGSGAEASLVPLHEAARRRTGAVVVSSHFGHWELGAVLLSQLGFRVNVLTLAAADRDINEFRGRMRARFGVKTIYLSRSEGELPAHLAMLGALRRGEIVTMLTERESSESLVQVSMFGRGFMVPRGAAVLSALTGAPIIPAFVVHEGGGTYRPILETPILADPSAPDRQQEILRVTQKMASVFEYHIARHPDQWYNFVE